MLSKPANKEESQTILEKDGIDPAKEAFMLTSAFVAKTVAKDTEFIKGQSGFQTMVIVQEDDLRNMADGRLIPKHLARDTGYIWAMHADCHYAAYNHFGLPTVRLQPEGWRQIIAIKTQRLADVATEFFEDPGECLRRAWHCAVAATPF